MYSTRKNRGVISLAVVIITLSFLLSGCNFIPQDLIQKIIDMFKGKQQQALPAPQTPAPIISPDQTSPQEQTNPAPVQQDVPAAGSQAGAGTIIVNNYPPAVNAGAVTSTSPWWSSWGGGTVAPELENPPEPQNPPITTGGILVYNVGFIPDGGQSYVNETTTGTRGMLYGLFANKYDTAKNLRGRISVDGTTVKDETVFVSAQTNNGFTLYPYMFNSEGPHTLWFSIDGLSDEDRTRNEATSTITVNAAAPDDGGPGGGPGIGGSGTGGNQGGNTGGALVITGIGYVPSWATGFCGTTTVGERGVIRATITNRTDQTANGTIAMNLNLMQIKREPVSVRRNSTLDIDVPHIFTQAGDYGLHVDLYSEDTQGQREGLDGSVRVVTREAANLQHNVSGRIELYGPRGITTTVTDKDSCRIKWSVTNSSREAARNVRVYVLADNVTKYSGTLDLNPGQERSGWVEGISFTRSGGRHSINLRVDDDKQFIKDITVTHFDVTGTIELLQQNGAAVREINDLDVYKIRYAAQNNSRDAAFGVRVQVKINDVARKDVTLDINPSPGRSTGEIDNVAFDRPGRYKLTIQIGPEYHYDWPFTVVHKEPWSRALTGELDLYGPNGQPTTTVTTADTCRILYVLGYSASDTPQIFRVKVTVDNTVKVDKEVHLPGGASRQGNWIENIKFDTPGPHNIMMVWDRERHIQKDITVTDGSIHIINPPKKTLVIPTETTTLAQTEPQPPERLARPVPNPDACATDIGFIPNGSRDYYDIVTSGKKGSIYAVFCNTSDQELKNLRVYIVVDNTVLRDSVKTRLAPGERAAISVPNYWFKTGRHKMILVLDPNNEIPESNKRNNKISHYIDAVPRQGSQPQRSYDQGASTQALSGLIGALGNMSSDSGSSGPTTYTPPAATTSTPPKVTLAGWDGGSSGTTTKKKVVPLSVKSMGS